jgi:hypothetical protein
MKPFHRLHAIAVEFRQMRLLSVLKRETRANKYPYHRPSFADMIDDIEVIIWGERWSGSDWEKSRCPYDR